RGSRGAPSRWRKLDTEFTCPFCGHLDAVECRIDRKDRGVVSRLPGVESYGSSADALTEPVDIYSDSASDEVQPYLEKESRNKLGIKT
ncbi:hypothetical protein C2845_PM09G03760, partial [Panicum miliaceum]